MSLKSGSESLSVIESGTIRQIGYGFLVFYSNFVPNRNVFEIFDLTLKPGLGSLKVIGIDTD